MAERYVQFAVDTPALPEELLLARDVGQVLFIAGAGISRAAPSNLPDFRGLVAEVYNSVDATLGRQIADMLAVEAKKKTTPPWTDFVNGLTPSQQAEIKRFSLGEYDNVLGMLERRLDPTPDRSSAMRRSVVRILAQAKRTNSLHKSLTSLGQRYGRPFMATTNFDRLLEKAAVQKRLSPTTYALGAMPRPSRRPDFNGVFHIHGALPQGINPTDLVLTDQDFGDVYLRRRIAADFIYDAARIFNLVLVGYSLSDAPMRYLLNAIAGDELHFPDIKRRFAIVPVAGSDPVIEADWRARGIVPITYDQSGNHATLERLLGVWAESVPQPGNTKWEQRHLIRITRRSPADTSEMDRALFGYVFRRASPSDRLRLSAFIQARRIHLGWLDAINSIMREGMRLRDA